MGRKRTGADEASASFSQTLDRGLRALEVIAFSDEPLSVAAIAEQMGVSKSIAYRLVRTLEARSLVRRTGTSLYQPSLYLGRLGAKSFRMIETAAAPVMRKTARALEQTVYVAVREGDEMVTIAVQEPEDFDGIAYRPSSRHVIGRGAMWMAWCAGQEPNDEDTRDILKAREAGYAMSTGEVIPGLSGIASPILAPSGECVACVGTVFLDRGEDTAFIGRKLLVAAQLIGEDLA